MNGPKRILFVLLVFAITPVSYLFCGPCYSKKAQVIPTPRRSKRRLQSSQECMSDVTPVLRGRLVMRRNALPRVLQVVPYETGQERGLVIADQGLQWALHRQGPKEVSCWLDDGADVGAKDLYGQTHLHEAVLLSPLESFHCQRSFLIDSTKLLLARGVDLEAHDCQGCTPLARAALLSLSSNTVSVLAESGVTKVLLRLFLECGSDIILHPHADEMW